MKASEFRKLIREEIQNILKEKNVTTSKNALERTVDQIMDPLVLKAVDAANNELASAMKQLDSKLKGKTISNPEKWQGTIVGVIPVLKSYREQGQKRTAPVLKRAEPGIKVKITSVKNPNDSSVKVGEIVNMDFYLWVNSDVELI